MVVFTCNRCGDSLKKNKVDQHLRICPTNTLTCIDCLKDFNLNSFVNHVECITEDQKYGGPDYKGQNFKGKNKQNEWIKKIKQLIENNSYPKEINSILNNLLKYENIPRKKQKFINFIKNSFRIRNENLIEKIWSIFEESIKVGKNTNDNLPPKQISDSSKSDTSKENHHLKDGEPKNMKTEESNMDSHQNGNTEQENRTKLKMKHVIAELLEQNGNLSEKKLKKKVLKKYRYYGYDDTVTLKRFEKNIHKFIINNGNEAITSAY